MSDTLQPCGHTDDQQANAILDEPCVCCMRDEIDRLREPIREAIEYLDSNELNSIAAGSILHRKLRAALAGTADQPAVARDDLDGFELGHLPLCRYLTNGGPCNCGRPADNSESSR